MGRTIGYHVVKSGYGLWLPGDERGHWSDTWDREIGYVEPHTLHAGDPERRRMAEERRKHPPVWFDEAMIRVILAALRQREQESTWEFDTVAVEPTHVHLLILTRVETFTARRSGLRSQSPRRACETSHEGPVLAKGKWCHYIYDWDSWSQVRAYIDRHRTHPTVRASHHPQPNRPLHLSTPPHVKPRMPFGPLGRV